MVDGAVFQVTSVLGRKRLQDKDVSISLLDLRRDGPAGAAHHLGDRARYPASVVKLLLLALAHDRAARGELELDKALTRHIDRMIGESSNPAMRKVFDAVTGTRSGPKLEGAARTKHLVARQAVDRWASDSLGLRGVRAVNKTWWAKDPSPRDKQARRALGRNKLSTAAAARLMHLIVAGRFGGAEGRDHLLEVLRRTPSGAPGADPDDRQNKLIGAALPKGAKLWNKSGWTSKTCHDVALVELPRGRRYILAIFTTPRGKKGTDCAPLRKLAQAIVDRL